MSSAVTEIVVYTVKNPETAAQARKTLPGILASYDGFIAYEPLASAASSRTFVDIVRWRDLEAAKSASQSIMHDARAAGFMHEIEDVKLMDHLVAT
jgi:quinol monooxygenase YgiN